MTDQMSEKAKWAWCSIVVLYVVLMLGWVFEIMHDVAGAAGDFIRSTR